LTITEPIPDLQWGKGAWQDYISNWRTRDTGWMQERLILRYQTSAARTTDWGATPKVGQVTYNDETKTLEMWRPAIGASPAGWARSLMFQNLVSNRDDTTGVYLYHPASSNTRGVMFTPTNFVVDQPTNFLTGALTIDATGMSLKIGAATAKLATDADGLTVDKQVKSPLLVGDNATVTGVVTAGSVTASAVTVTSSLTLAGATVSGGVLNGNSGTIGSINLAAGVVTIAAGSVNASAPGVQAGQGYFYGDANSAYMRQRTSAGVAAGAAYVQAQANDVVLNGPTTVQFSGGDIQIRGGNNLDFYNAAGTKLGVGIGPIVNAASDPGAANYPEGTIWIS
jgi:hypothetical protein